MAVGPWQCGSGCAVRGATRRVAVAASTPRMRGEKGGGPAGPCAPPAHRSRRPAGPAARLAPSQLGPPSKLNFGLKFIGFHMHTVNAAPHHVMRARNSEGWQLCRWQLCGLLIACAAGRASGVLFVPAGDERTRGRPAAQQAPAHAPETGGFRFGHRPSQSTDAWPTRRCHHRLHL